MADQGKRKVQARGEITLPQDYRNDNNIQPGDHIKWKRHSRDNTKLIIEVKKEDSGV